MAPIHTRHACCTSFPSTSRSVRTTRDHDARASSCSDSSTQTLPRPTASSAPTAPLSPSRTYPAPQLPYSPGPAARQGAGSRRHRPEALGSPGRLSASALCSAPMAHQRRPQRNALCRLPPYPPPCSAGPRCSRSRPGFRLGRPASAPGAGPAWRSKQAELPLKALGEALAACSPCTRRGGVRCSAPGRIYQSGARLTAPSSRLRQAVSWLLPGLSGLPESKGLGEIVLI